MPCDNADARTTSITLLAYRERCNAAWPAELPPPMTTAQRPVMACASETLAP